MLRKISRRGQYIIAERVSGLGDMLAQASQLGCLADLHGVDCYVDWRRSFYSKPDDLTNLFGTLIFHERLKCITTLKTYQKAFLPCQQLASSDEAYLLLGETEELKTKLPLRISCKINALPYRTYSHFLQEFNFRSDVQQAAETALETSKSRFLVGIHYRHGNGEFSELKSDERVTSEIRNIHALFVKFQQDQKDALAVVCTDSIVSATMFRAIFSHDEIAVIDKSWPQPNSGPIHYGHLLVDGGGPAPQTILFEALVDMTILANCDILMRAEFGSFPDWPQSRLQSQGIHQRNAIVEYPYFRRKFQRHEKAWAEYLRANQRLRTLSDSGEESGSH